jgi:hypothetical protein
LASRPAIIIGAQKRGVCSLLNIFVFQFHIPWGHTLAPDRGVLSGFSGAISLAGTDV